ncbi:MAG: AtpZ/AtpI family protein [Hahellaceae bacterium]|nr:AtpZ/AtpI family protein [Hahellaceae bacterium]
MTYRKLQEAIRRDRERDDKARHPSSLVAEAMRVLGVLGFTFTLPVVGGAYLGQWLDSLSAGYSVRWTVGCILLGLLVGGVNAWLLLKE